MKQSIAVLDSEAWDAAGRDLAEHDPGAFRRLLITARGLVRLAKGEDEGEVLATTLPMLESSDGLLS